MTEREREKLVQAIEQRLFDELKGKRLLNPIVKKSDNNQTLVSGLGKPITAEECRALARNFDDWKVVARRNIDRDAPVLNMLKRLLYPADDRLGIGIPDDLPEYSLHESLVQRAERLIGG